MANTKEKPLIDSASDPGPLPGFLFANGLVSGFVAVMTAAFFGIIGALFVFGSHSSGQAGDLLNVARAGAAVGLGVGAIAIIYTLARALREQDKGEKTYRLLYVLGGVIAVALLIGCDIFFADRLHALVDPLGDILGVKPYTPG